MVSDEDLANTFKRTIKVSQHERDEHSLHADLEECKDDRHKFISTDGKYVYYLGVIDYLQLFTFNKQFEYVWRDRFTHKYLSSCCPPEPYAERFFDFMNKEVIVNQDVPFDDDYHLPTNDEENE